MNPARTFGPDLVGADFSHYWVYIAGPLAGAVIAVGIAFVLRGGRRWPGPDQALRKEPYTPRCRSQAPREHCTRGEEADGQIDGGGANQRKAALAEAQARLGG
jgi:Major intrinsic protein